MNKAITKHERKVSLIDDGNMFNDHPLRISINPFGHIVTAFQAGDRKRSSMIEECMHVLLPEPTGKDGGSDNNKYFRDEPRRRVAFATAYLAFYKPELCCPGGIWSVVATPHLYAECLDRAAEEAGSDGELALHSEALIIKEAAEKNPDHESQHMAEAVNILRFFAAGTELHEAGMDASMTHQDALDQGIDLFITAPNSEIKYWSVYLGLHQVALLRAQLSKLGQRRTHLILEEMTATPCAILLEKIVTVRSFGMRYLMCYQSTSEVVRVYGEHMNKTHEDNTYVRQYFGLDPQGAKEKSEQIGDTFFVSGSLSGKTGDRGSVSGASQRLITPDELMRMPITQQLVFCKTADNMVGWFRCGKISAHEIDPICHDLLENPFEPDGGLKPNPRVRI